MIRANKGDIKIKGEIDKVIFEFKDLFESAIEIFGIKQFTNILKNAKQLRGYKVTIEKLELDKQVEKDIMNIIMKNQK